jgi:hypothetical protein
MNSYDDCTPQGIADLMIHHAEQLRKLMHRWHEIEPILVADPETIIIHNCDLELQLAMESFEAWIDYLVVEEKEEKTR